MNRKNIFPLIVLFLFPSLLFSGNPTGFNFLRTLVGARPSAMGGAFVAVPADIYDTIYNPAGLAAINTRQGTITYLNHLLDFQSGYAAYVHPLKQGTLGIGILFFDFGQFEGKDERNNDTGEFGANSLAFSLSYSTSLIKNVYVGGSGKFIRFQIDDFNSTALALDLGLLVSFPDKLLNIGAGVFNLGKTTSAFIDTKDDLPLNIQVGLSKRLEHLPLLVSGSLVKFTDDDGVDFRLGGEFTLTEELFLRLGYNSLGRDQKVNTDKDRLAGVSIGLGFKVNKFNLDYSFSSFGEVGSLNRLTFSGRF
ncbi:MAG: hypothetical protein D6813_13620 [Calditrichaeota bacterium]|nr:MAG: hypothetical protein D6813_13620 [Calditrichota bacterium]